MVFRNIAISGRIAAGSSSLARALSEKLGWNLRDGGQIFRDISQQRGFDLEKQPQQYGGEVDRLVDRESRRLLEKKSHFIVTSKLAGFLSRDLPGTLRVLLVCPVEVRIQRYAAHRGYSEKEARRLIALREREDQEKFSRLYGNHDFFDPEIFQIVLQSNRQSVNEEMKKILELSRRDLIPRFPQ